MKRLILASTSRYRRELLGRLGLPFECVPPAVDEAALAEPGIAPQPLAERLADAKARAVAGQQPEAVVVGSDQLVDLEGTVLGKPGTPERAIEQLLSLAGRTHRLITAVAVVTEGRTLTHTDVTRLTMRRLTRDEAERYVRADQPLDCAGAYKLEARGTTLFDAIESADHTAIIGLPLLALCRMLREVGYTLP